VEEFDMQRRPVRVVGVVGNVRSESLATESRETVYFPYRFQPWLPMTVTVRGVVNPTEILPLLRREISAMDPDVPVANVRFMDDYVDDAMAQTRFTLTLIGVFAVLALLLASLGLYGVISYSVRQRTREIGVRITFGASEGDVMKLVLKQGMVVAMLGVGVGLVASFVLTRLVASLLVGVTATDPVTFVGIPVVLLLVSLVASYVPARRAMSVDPVEALREE
jgi:putative ABC transport system permease protein